MPRGRRGTAGRTGASIRSRLHGASPHFTCRVEPLSLWSGELDDCVRILHPSNRSCSLGSFVRQVWAGGARGCTPTGKRALSTILRRLDQKEEAHQDGNNGHPRSGCRRRRGIPPVPPWGTVQAHLPKSFSRGKIYQITERAQRVHGGRLRSQRHGGNLPYTLISTWPENFTQTGSAGAFSREFLSRQTCFLSAIVTVWSGGGQKATIQVDINSTMR